MNKFLNSCYHYFMRYFILLLSFMIIGINAAIADDLIVPETETEIEQEYMEPDTGEINQTEEVTEDVIDANTRDENGQLLVRTYCVANRFGLEKSDGTKITKPIYKKLIRLGDKSWIVQYRYKYGIIDYNGDYVILPKYRNVDRIAGKYVKLGNDHDYGLYNEYGGTIIQPEYSSIDMLYGKMFLTCKNYQYGVVDMEGNTLLNNEFDDIYMPKPNVMMVQYQGHWSKIERMSDTEITLPFDINEISEDKDFKITNLVVNTGVGAGYSVVTLTDYFLKMISLISPAYEATIDELMYSQGADTLSILVKFTWLPKFPFTYAKQYYRLLRKPNSGPLANTRSTLKKQMR